MKTTKKQKKDILQMGSLLGHSRKHPYLPHRGNWKLTPLPPSDVPIHLLLSETIFSPLPLCGGKCGSFLERPMHLNLFQLRIGPTGAAVFFIF